MGVLVKICGVNSVAAADAAVRAGADFAGLVFHRNSPRNLEPDAAAGLAQRMRSRLRLVALTADARDDELARIVDAVRPDMLQLHGREPPERIAAIRTRFGLPVIKAVAVASVEDFSPVPAVEAAADMLMFDAKAPAGAAVPGGRGASFDWQLLRRQRFSRPWFLAGGLDASNVARALAQSGAEAVDVSSGVERAPGIKDVQLIADFVAAAKAPVPSEAHS